MHAPSFPKILVPTAAGIAALAVAAPVQAKVATPQKHPEIIGILKHQIGTPKKHPEIIGILKHQIGTPKKHPEIIGILKRGQMVINMRKSGGDGEH